MIGKGLRVVCALAFDRATGESMTLSMLLTRYGGAKKASSAKKQRARREHMGARVSDKIDNVITEGDVIYAVSGVYGVDLKQLRPLVCQRNWFLARMAVAQHAHQLKHGGADEDSADEDEDGASIIHAVMKGAQAPPGATA